MATRPSSSRPHRRAAAPLRREHVGPLAARVRAPRRRGGRALPGGQRVAARAGDAGARLL